MYVLGTRLGEAESLAERQGSSKLSGSVPSWFSVKHNVTSKKSFSMKCDQMCVWVPMRGLKIRSDSRAWLGEGTRACPSSGGNSSSHGCVFSMCWSSRQQWGTSCKLTKQTAPQCVRKDYSLAEIAPCFLCICQRF